MKQGAGRKTLFILASPSSLLAPIFSVISVISVVNLLFSAYSASLRWRNL